MEGPQPEVVGSDVTSMERGYPSPPKYQEGGASMFQFAL